MEKLEIFGDSILKGVIYNGDTGRYRLFGRSLEERMSETGVSLHRNCHMGSTVEGGLERVKKFCAASGNDLRGSTVLLEFGGNDCAYDWKEVSAEPEAAHRPAVTPERFAQLYQETIDLIRSCGGKVLISSLIPIDAERYMSYISRGLSYDNILRWLGDVSMLYRWHERYNRTVEALAEKNDCILIDLREEFLLSHSFPSLICDDGIHPTEEGHRLIEDKLLTVV